MRKESNSSIIQSLDMNGAHDPSSKIKSHGLTFQQLYGKLDAALKLDKEAKIILLREEASRSVRKDNMIRTIYAGQGRYSHSIRNGKHNTHSYPSLISGCHNCGNPSHTLKYCPEPKNLARKCAEKQQLRNYEITAQLDSKIEHTRKLTKYWAIANRT